ncbi:glycosyltransferase family 4 protein [Fulvivirga sp. M361]|uniref:glycosyltransferase family 4 protein n=1 Tax=Fulvivirga sp. M361 TaxID=2594266 RepID=UPI00117B83A5|nr:glycosyltransferase family 4 protein [Fulvivirga sp. M361]TRX49350.1 glycosyltransferase family 4 protein [Fulvivirga sp. M361]
MRKKVLFICLHRPGRSPSQRFRFEQYLDFLDEEGYDCSHVHLLNEKNDRIFYAAGKYWQKLFILIHSTLTLINQSFFKKYDIVFVQREAFMLGTSYFERRMAKRSKLIFDFDDAIWKQQTGEIKSKNRFFYFLKNPNKTKHIIRAAQMVFAGNQYLADFALPMNPNVKIIPTTIDTIAYHVVPKRETGKVCIGWSGSFSTIIHFKHILEALKELKKKYQDKIYFKVIGDGSFTDEDLEIQGVSWQQETEVKDLSEIDIGIMPLPDDEWTKGKCGLKGLQYMALGIPTIMSPVGVNTDIIKDGVNGFFASSDPEWIQKLSILIDSPLMREKMGIEGRKVVKERFSVEANKKLYLDHFNELVHS